MSRPDGFPKRGPLVVDPRLTRSQAEAEFVNAMQEYKRLSGRLFPTWSEVLEVATSLGYTKPS